MDSASIARAALLILTEYDDAGVLLLDPLLEEVLALEVEAVAAAPEFDVTEPPVACARCWLTA